MDEYPTMPSAQGTKWWKKIVTFIMAVSDADTHGGV